MDTNSPEYKFQKVEQFNYWDERMKREIDALMNPPPEAEPPPSISQRLKWAWRTFRITWFDRN